MNENNIKSWETLFGKEEILDKPIEFTDMFCADTNKFEQNKSKLNSDNFHKVIKLEREDDENQFYFCIDSDGLWSLARVKR